MAADFSCEVDLIFAVASKSFFRFWFRSRTVCEECNFPKLFIKKFALYILPFYYKFYVSPFIISDKSED